MIEARDSKYPAFRRYDAKNWNKAKFYLGAMTLLLIRMTLVFSTILLTIILLKITTLSHTFEKNKPVSGKIKLFLMILYNNSCRILAFVTGITISKKTLSDFDYS